MMPGMPKGRTHDYQCHGITSIASLVAGLAPDFPVLLTPGFDVIRPAWRREIAADLQTLF